MSTSGSEGRVYDGSSPATVLSSLYGIPAFVLVIVAVDFWTDRGLPLWAYLVTFSGLSTLILIALRMWKLLPPHP